MSHIRTVLVTGAAGFIGSALCRRLVDAELRVVGYDNLSRGRVDHLPPEVRLLQGDIRDRARWRQTVVAMHPDTVVHLAAMHFIPDCIARPEETRDVNVEGTASVLAGCRDSSVRQVIFASTAAVYAPSDTPCTEDRTAVGPLEIYGESKRAGEVLLEQFHTETGTAVHALRLFNAVGRHETNPHVIPHIFESLRQSDTIALGNIAPRRDYIDTRDIADAIVAVLTAPDAAPVLNIGTGVAYSVSEIVERLGRLLQRPIVIEQDPSRARATERMVLVADIARIRHATGWRPRLSIGDSLGNLLLAYGLRTGATLAG